MPLDEKTADELVGNLTEASEAVQNRDTERLFAALAPILAEQQKLDYHLYVAERMFTTATVRILGLDATVSQIAQVAGVLEEGASSIIRVEPLLFERMMRRQYGEPEIARGVPQDTALIHFVVGSALMTTPPQKEAVLEAVSIVSEQLK